MRGKTTIWKDITSAEERKTLTKGVTVARPYRSKLIVKTLGADGAYSRQAITDTTEVLTVNLEKETSFYIRKPDEIQSNYKTANLYSDDSIKAQDEWIDGQVLAEAANANSVVGAYEIAGTGSASDGLGITVTTSNILSIFSKVRMKMKRKHIPKNDRWAVLSQEIFEVLVQFLQGKDSNYGDLVGKNPNEVGKWGGFRLFVTEGCYWTGVLNFETNPTANDTIVINGVTFTFKADTITTAGYIHICSDAENTLNQLVSAINTPGTSVTEATNAGFYALSAADQLLLDGIVAVDGATELQLKGYGVGYIEVSETLSAAADIWTTTEQIQHNLFGQGRPIDLVIQKYPSLAMVPRSGYVGQDFVSWFLAGLLSFVEGADTLVDLQARSDAF